MRVVYYTYYSLHYISSILHSFNLQKDTDDKGATKKNIRKRDERSQEKLNNVAL